MFNHWKINKVTKFKDDSWDMRACRGRNSNPNRRCFWRYFQHRIFFGKNAISNSIFAICRPAGTYSQGNPQDTAWWRSEASQRIQKNFIFTNLSGLFDGPSNFCQLNSKRLGFFFTFQYREKRFATFPVNLRLKVSENQNLLWSKAVEEIYGYFY